MHKKILLQLEKLVHGERLHRFQTRTVHDPVMDHGLFCKEEVCQEEPKEEPMCNVALPNSTSHVPSIAGGGGGVIGQE